MGTSCTRLSESMENSRSRRDEKDLLLLYGDRYDSKTRAIEAICISSDLPYEFMPILTYKNEHLSKSFTDLNPNQTIPFLIKGRSFGSKTIVLKYAEIAMFLLR